MIPIEALELALKKEEEALNLYKDLAVKHPEIRELLTDLADQEYRHRKMIQEKIAELRRY